MMTFTMLFVILLAVTVNSLPSENQDARSVRSDSRALSLRSFHARSVRSDTHAPSRRSFLARSDTNNRAVRSAGCDQQYANLSSTHTMCLTDVGSDDPLTTSEKQAIVDKHNNYRSNVSPTATNLVKLVWDDDIAVIAAKWARQCNFAHDEYDDRQVPSLPGVSIGQNLAAGYSSVITATEAWHYEVNYFEYGVGNITDEDVGHYTQIVGYRAVRLGCGKALCPSSPYARFQVCNYAWGQYEPELTEPYTNGTSCADCPSGNCTNNLCDCGGKVCLNGGDLDTKTCSCQCSGLYTGDTCAEQYCGGKVCLNGGDLNTQTCACQCYNGYTGDTCAEQLCGGKTCNDGGYLDEATCSCQCFGVYYGDTCQFVDCTSASDHPACTSYPASWCPLSSVLREFCPVYCGLCP